MIGRAPKVTAITPLPGQLAFATSKTRHLSLEGEHGSGKTTALLLAALVFAAENQGNALVLDGGPPHMMRLLHEQLIDLTQMPQFLTVASNRSSGVLFENGCTVTLDRCADPDDLDRHRGRHYGFVGFDDLGLHAYQAFIRRARAQFRDPLIRTTRTDDREVMRLTRNPHQPAGFYEQAEHWGEAP